MGFPSEIIDDSLLDMALPASEPFEHAEERRLFYVALTRALIIEELQPYQAEAPGKPSSSCSGMSPVPNLERLTPTRRIPKVTG